MYSLLRLLQLLVVVYNLCNFGSAKVISCGGFIKSFAKIDFTKIQIKLLTTEGNLKYETECNPNNGYFMIPIYNKGVYVFRIFAPNGWIFAPESLRIDVNGIDDICTKGEDINFSLYGFSVSGKVKSGEESGPSQFDLGLYSSNGTVVSETVTSTDGEYEFKAPPGDYIVSTIRSEECVERGSVPVKIIDKPVRVNKDIKISGHSVSIAVQKEDGAAFANVEISFVSDIKLQFNELPQHYSRPSVAQKNNQWIYTMKTNLEGTAQICLPPGKYSIQPKYKKESVQFSFAPPQTTISMKSEAQKISFRVSGFSTYGNVNINKVPIQGATILINSSPKAESDEHGRYQLDDVKEGQYVITAKKKYYEFETVTVKLSSSNPTIPDIVVKSIEVCGVVEVDGGVPRNSIVEFTNEVTKKQLQIQLDQDGHFCESVPLGIYSITPSNDLPYVTPKSIRADLTSLPKLDIRFTQFKANVEGELTCLDECKELVIELHNTERKLLEIPAQAKFKFNDLAPDTYTLKIIGGSNFCWENEEVKFVILNSDIKGLKLKQQGYAVQISTTHTASLKWESENDKAIHGALELQPGLNQFCIPVRGKYKISFDSCYEFDVKSPATLSIPMTSPIALKTQRAKLFTSVKVSKIDKNHKLSIQLKDPNGGTTMLENPFVKDLTYYFEFYVEYKYKGNAFELIPHSDTYLFSPDTVSFSFSGECDVNVASFNAEVGKFINGKISTPILGVNVKAIYKKDSNKLQGCPKVCHVGPVWNDNDYEIELEKEGYKFFPQDDGFNFKVVKLSQLKINFLDSKTAKPLPDVLVSLSGANDYRSNNIIDESGSINYIGLPPGEYFIRPILQEYKFEDNLIPIKIKEGETENVTLLGERYAYSVFGKVTTLSDEPIPTIRVDAVSHECGNLQEEDTTDTAGHYRIRGLKPECTYHVRPKLEKYSHWRTFPQYFNIKTEKNDKIDVNFKLFGFIDLLEVFGMVNFENVEMPQTVHVILSKKLEVVQEVTLHSPSTVFFFQNLTIDHQEYTVSIEPNELSKHKFDSEPVHFKANTTFVALKLYVRPQRKAADVEISMSSYVGMTIIVLITLAFFNQAKLKPIIEQTVGNIQDLIQANINRNQPISEQELLRRRRMKKT